MRQEKKGRGGDGKKRRWRHVEEKGGEQRVDEATLERRDGKREKGHEGKERGGEGTRREEVGKDIRGREGRGHEGGGMKDLERT